MAKNKDYLKILKQSGISQADKKEEIDWVPIDSLGLTDALGCGLPRGRIIELYGAESGGKTLLSTYFITQFQKQNLGCVFIDVEQSFSASHAKELGVDISKLEVVDSSDEAEDIFNIIEALVEVRENLGLIIVDSVASMSVEREKDGEYGDSNMGVKARLLSQALRKLTLPIAKKKVTVVFINQVREELGSLFKKETTPGGRAIKFHSSIRLKVKRLEWIGKNGKLEKDERPIGAISEVLVVKNKVSAPYRKCQMSFLFKEGIQTIKDVFSFSVKYGFITKGGAWFNYGDLKWQGETKVISYLEENPELREELRVKCLENILKDNNSDKKDDN